MDEENFARREPGDGVDELISRGVAAEIEFFDLGGEEDGRIVGMEGNELALLGLEDFSSRCIRICVAYEKDAVTRVGEEVSGERVRNGIFRNHPAREGINTAGRGIWSRESFIPFTAPSSWKGEEKLHVFENFESRMVATAGMRMGVVDRGHLGAKATDKDWGGLRDGACTFKFVDQGEDFLGFSEGEDRDED